MARTARRFSRRSGSSRESAEAFGKDERLSDYEIALATLTDLEFGPADEHV